MTYRKVDKKFETAYSEEKLLGYIITLSRLTADEALYIPRRSVCYYTESEDRHGIVVSHSAVDITGRHSHTSVLSKDQCGSPKKSFHHRGCRCQLREYVSRYAM